MGYGQKFTDEINDDWGGKAYDDIMAMADKIESEPWADKDRFAAAGGSYGGYMVNWILGHTQRFKALVSHAGVYDLRSMAGETEELWFTNWEFKGTPWDNPDSYAKWSPSYLARDFPPHPRHPRRTRLPRPSRPRHAIIYCPPVTKSTFEVTALPRRRPLDAKATKQPPLVQERPGVDHRIHHYIQHRQATAVKNS